MPVNVTVLAGLTSPRSRRNLLLASGSRLGGDDPSAPRLRWVIASSFYRVSPPSSSSLVFCLHSEILLLLSLRRTLHFLYLLLTLPFSVLVTMATDFFEWGGDAGLMENTGACDTLAIHHCPSLYPLKSLSLSSLQLTAAGGKSRWTGARSMPSVSSCSVCPVFFFCTSDQTLINLAGVWWLGLVSYLRVKDTNVGFRFVEARYVCLHDKT